MSKWGVLLTIAFTGGLGLIGETVIKAVHISEMPEKFDKLESRMSSQETAQALSQKTLTDHGETLDRIEQKIDNMNAYQYRSASIPNNDLTIPHRNSSITEGKN